MSEHLYTREQTLDELVDDIFKRAYEPDSSMEVKTEDNGETEILEGVQANGSAITLARPTLQTEAEMSAQDSGESEGMHTYRAVIEYKVNNGPDEESTSCSRDYVFNNLEEHRDRALLVLSDGSMGTFEVGPGEVDDMYDIINGSDFSTEVGSPAT